MSTDAELLEAWAQGDRDAANALFERHFTRVYRFIRSKVATGAEDLVQETFTAAIAGRERLRDAASFRGYLFGVARNMLRQHFRKQHVRGEAADLSVHSVLDLCPGFNTALGKRQEHRLLGQALARLPVDYQVALELYYWEKLSGPELGEVLGLSEAGARSRLHRAKQALRAELERVSESATLVESTWTGLDRWASEIAGQLEPPVN